MNNRQTLYSRSLRNLPYAILLAASLISLPNRVWAQSGAPAQNTPASTTAAPPEKKASDEKERNFYEVLEDLLADFEYDLKTGEVHGLRDLAIRNVAVSENVPTSFKSHLELLVAERILKTSKSRLIQCLPCRAKKTTLNGDQVVITSTDTNPTELARVAKMAGISNFMDMAFSFQPSGMVLSFYITDPESGSVVWSRSYNSETSRSSAVKRGVDYSQVDQARRAAEYIPTKQFRATIFYLLEPNLSGYTGCLGFGLRLVERYDNRKKEVGFELNYIRDATSFITTSTDTTNLWAGFNITMLFLHSWNFIGEEENYNKVRGNLFVGLGGTFATGYLGALIRAGWEWRFGKHFGLAGSVGFRPPASAFLPSGTTTATSMTGVEAGLGISIIF